MEHLKSIMGTEEPIKIFSFVYVGVEDEERKLRRRKGNRMSSGLGAGAQRVHTK